MKKLSFPKYRISVLLIMIVIGTASVLFIACKKQAISDAEKVTQLSSKDPAIKDAHSFFLNTIVKNEIEGATRQVKTLSTKSNNPPPLRMGKIANLLEWDKSVETKILDSKYLFVPFNENIKPYKNKDFEFFRYLIFNKAADGKISLSVIEVLSDKGASIGQEKQALAIAALTNKLTNGAKEIDNINASVIFYNQDYNRETSFKLKDGAWSTFRISFRSDMEIALN